MHFCLLNCWYINMPCPAPALQCPTLCKTEFKFVNDLGFINSIRASRPFALFLSVFIFIIFVISRDEDIHIFVSFINAMFLCSVYMDLLSWPLISTKHYVNPDECGAWATLVEAIKIVCFYELLPFYLNGTKPILIMVKACCWLGIKPLPEPGTYISMRSGLIELRITAFNVCISIHVIEFWFCWIQQ